MRSSIPYINRTFELDIHEFAEDNDRSFTGSSDEEIETEQTKMQR